MERKLLINGLVFDGMGNEPVKADVLIAGNTIAQIGSDLQRVGNEEIYDVSGLAVTPGFVDMHRHCDKSPLESDQTDLTYKTVLLRQGITTVVTGNCGISMYPLNTNTAVADAMRDYYAPVLGRIDDYDAITSYGAYGEALEKCELSVNTAFMIGLGAIRIAVKGFLQEPLSREELVTCRTIIEDALRKGSPGVSIGLMYLPECYTTVEELIQLLEPVRAYDRLVTAHIRGEGDSLVKSVEEIIQIGRMTGCRMEISHFKSCGMENWNREIYKAINRIEEARAEGIRIDCDFYPYDCGSTTLMSMIPPQFINGDIQEALKLVGTEAGREQLRTMLDTMYEDWDNYAISLGWDKVILSAASAERNQEKIAKSITQITKEYLYRDEVGAVADLLTTENGGAAIIIRSMDQRDIDAIARLPYSCLISDAIYAETDRPHPRMYGAFPRFIHDYVFKRNVLPLKDAICKMTSVPAKRMGIQKRGMLKAGCYADINVFNPQVFRDRATYTDPVQYPQGLEYCFVNGALAVKKDVVIAQSCGQILRC